MRTFFSSPSNKNLNSSIKLDLSKYPKIFWALSKSSSASFSKLIKALSKSERASLTDPSEILTISLRASSVALPFSFSVIHYIYHYQHEPYREIKN